MEAVEINSRVTYFSSSSYAPKNNPIISFLAADFASSAKITKSTALEKVGMDFFFKMRTKRNYYRITRIRGAIGSIFRTCFKVMISSRYWCFEDISFISSDKNLTIFRYNSLTGKLLRAKKCTILFDIEFISPIFSLFVCPSIFSNASLIFRFVSYCIFITLCYAVLFFYQDNGIMRPFPPTSIRFCTWHSIK